MDRLSSFAFFVAILEKGGVAAAGREFGLSPAASSERLSALERHLGVTLLNRTTRSFSLTEEGEILLDAARELVAQANELESKIQFGARQLSGRIRIGAPEDLGHQRIFPIVERFMAKHPGVRVEIHLDDGYIDPVAKGFDFTVRYGSLKDSSLVVKKLTDNRRIVCAAPFYVDRFGAPNTPNQLADHNCLLMQFGSRVDRDWEFTVAGRRRTYRVSGNRLANNGAVIRQWCIEGHGIALKSLLDVQADLDAGRLARILEAYSLHSDMPLQIVYPGGGKPNARTSALMDLVARDFGQT